MCYHDQIDVLAIILELYFLLLFSKVSHIIISRLQSLLIAGTCGALRKFINGIVYVVSQILGPGIFVSPNIILQYSGSFGLSISLWMLGGVISIMCALCYCELRTSIKKCRGESAYLLKAYSFQETRSCLQHLGSLLAFLFTWASAFIIRPAAIALTAIVFARYFSRSLHDYYDIPLDIDKVIAIAVIIVTAALNCKLVGTMITKLVLLTSLFALLACAIIVIGIRHAIPQTSKCSPLAFNHPIEGTTHSPNNVALALSSVLWSFLGWDMYVNYSYTSEETQNAKNLPRSLIIGIFLVATVYILVNVSYFAVLSYEEILATEVVALSFGKATQSAAVISFFVAVSTFGATTWGLFAGSSSILFSVQDSELLSSHGSHQTFQTPIPAVILLAVLSAIFVVVGDIPNLVFSLSAGVWLFNGMTIAGLLIMRVTHKDDPRPYKVWLVAPILALLVSLYLVILPVTQKPMPVLMAYGGILLGVPVYAFLVKTPWRLKPEIFDRVSQQLPTLY